MLERHPATYFLLLGREHPSEPLAGRLMKNIIDQAIGPFILHIPIYATCSDGDVVSGSCTLHKYLHLAYLPDVCP